MGMKQPRKLLAEASERLDLPGDIAAGLPRMVLTGFSEFSLEHHGGILEYSAETVAASVRDGTVRVTGKGLNIRLMNREFLVVSGEIGAVELLPEDKK